MGSFSDGTLYINQLLTTNGGPPFNSDFIGFLTQIWDFDDQTNQVSTNNLSYIVVQNVPILTYNDQKTAETRRRNQIRYSLIYPTSSWSGYGSALQGVQPEVPPLPGQDPTILEDTHHQIRDFMFLDAAVNRIFSNSSSLTGPPAAIVFQGVTCQLNRIDLGAGIATEDATKPQVSQGPGPHTTSGQLLVLSTSVVSNPLNTGPALTFVQNDVTITLLLYELQDQNGQVVNAVPNWFGVAVPDRVTDFSKPILYFHPTPSQNKYIDTAPNGATDGNYFAKSATGPWTGTGRDWRELFAYVDRLGNQLAGAILQSANRNQVVIMPFYDNR